MPTLTIQLPGLPPVEHVLRDEMMTIGRMKGNTIALDDPSVSISHAKITRKNGEFFVKDLNSTNGTMLNGQSINEARLRDGDQIKFGEVIAHFRAEPAFPGASTDTTAASQPAPPSAPPTPAPAPTPQPIAGPSTTFTSKSLVSQAPQLARTPAPAQTASPARLLQRPKQSRSWLLPALGGIAAVATAVVLGWIFFGGTESGPSPVDKAIPPAPAVAPVPITQSLDDLKKALSSPEVAERRRAAAALHAQGSGAKDAVPELRNALNDSDQEVRMWSALALINNKSYDKATAPILIRTLQHENSMLRQVSCLSLALIPYEEPEKEPVVAALSETASKDADEEVRNAAKSALKIISPETGVQ